MADLDWMIPRPARWLLDRAWLWLAAKVLPQVDDALLDVGDVDEELAA